MPRSKAIVIGTPSLGIVSFWWTRQMLSLIHPLNIGKRFAFIRDDGGGQIAATRNKVVADALAMENDDLEIDSIFWVDDDVLVMPGALLALYNHHVPIASGVYFTKCELPEPLIFPSRLGGTAKFEPDAIIRDAWGHGMGLCLVKMDVYRQMLSEQGPGLIGTDKHGRPEYYKTTEDFRVSDGMLDCGGTEDLYFCHNARKIGIPSLIDCRKHTFGWHFDMHRNKGFPEEQFKQWSKCDPIVWHTADGSVTWT